MTDAPVKPRRWTQFSLITLIVVVNVLGVILWATIGDVLAGNAKRFSLNLKDVTLEKVLDAIVEADPRYEWSEDNWVINLKPRGAPGEAGLDDKIQVFVAIDLDLCEVIRDCNKIT